MDFRIFLIPKVAFLTTGLDVFPIPEAPSMFPLLHIDDLADAICFSDGKDSGLEHVNVGSGWEGGENILVGTFLE